MGSILSWRHAINEYLLDHDPREPIFVFTKRSLVHFAVDTGE
jgi:type I restriction enzyme R subunit